MPIFVIDDRDDKGNPGMTVFMARNQEQAIKKFFERHPSWGIEEIEQCEWLELAMIDEKGKTSFRRRA